MIPAALALERARAARRVGEARRAVALAWSSACAAVGVDPAAPVVLERISSPELDTACAALSASLERADQVERYIRSAARSGPVRRGLSAPRLLVALVVAAALLVVIGVVADGVGSAFGWGALVGLAIAFGYGAARRRPGGAP